MNEKPNIYVLSDLHFDKKALPGYVKQELIKLENDPIAHFKYMEEVLKSGDYQYSKNKIKQNIVCVHVFHNGKKGSFLFGCNTWTLVDEFEFFVCGHNLREYIDTSNSVHRDELCLDACLLQFFLDELASKTCFKTCGGAINSEFL